MNTPQVLFLDEPTTGLDPATRLSVWSSLNELREEEGITIFLTTHYMERSAVFFSLLSMLIVLALSGSGDLLADSRRFFSVFIEQSDLSLG